jgi:hypothetical protein
MEMNPNDVVLFDGRNAARFDGSPLA